MRERGAETQAEGEAGSMHGSRRGTWFRILGSRPEPKADAQPLSHQGVPASSASVEKLGPNWSKEKKL